MAHRLHGKRAVFSRIPCMNTAALVTLFGASVPAGNQATDGPTATFANGLSRRRSVAGNGQAGAAGSSDEMAGPMPFCSQTLAIPANGVTSSEGLAGHIAQPVRLNQQPAHQGQFAYLLNKGLSPEPKPPTGGQPNKALLLSVTAGSERMASQSVLPTDLKEPARATPLAGLADPSLTALQAKGPQTLPSAPAAGKLQNQGPGNDYSRTQQPRGVLPSDHNSGGTSGSAPGRPQELSKNNEPAADYSLGPAASRFSHHTLPTTPPGSDSFAGVATGSPKNGGLVSGQNISFTLHQKQPFSEAVVPGGGKNSELSVPERFVMVHQKEPAAERRAEVAQLRLSLVAARLAEQLGRPDASTGPTRSITPGQNRTAGLPLLAGPRGPVEIVQSQTQNVADRSVGRDSADAGLPFGGQLAATVPLQSPRSVFAAAASVDQNASSGFDKQDFFSTVAQNIHQSIQFCLQRNEQQVTINLYPPELGRVRVRIRQEDQQITGLLEVEKLQTKNEIQQSLPEILRTLQDWQVSVKRMEVVLSENSSSQGGCARDQSLVDYGYPGEQTFGGTQVADHPAGQAAAWQFDGGEEQEQLSIMGADVVDCLNLWV